MTDKSLVAQGVANQLYATEKAIDAAIAEASQLMSVMMSAQAEVRVSPVYTDEAVARAAECMAALAASRRQVVSTHNELEQLKQKLGMRVRMFGKTAIHERGAVSEERLAS